MRKFLLTLVVPLLAVPFVLADAGAQEPVTLSGVDSCDSATGDHVITWTIENFLGSPITIGTVTVTPVPADPSASTSAFTPNPVPATSSATATTTIDGTFVGSVQIDVAWSGTDFGDNVRAGVELATECPPPPTTTTSTTTTTIPTTTTTVRPAVVTTPTFTG